MKEIEKYGWKYQAYNEKDKFAFKIASPFKLDPPNNLYRYYSLSKFSIQSIIENYLYASHPDQFNDLYDCHEDLINFDDDEVIVRFLNSENDPTEENRLKQALLDDREPIVQSAKRHLRQIIYRMWGIICMTSNPNNILMWSYYSNNRGFLVEYAYKEFPFAFHGPFPVNYQDELLPISLIEATLPICAIFQTNIKSSGWKHEDEWRILAENPKGQMESPDLFPELAKLGGEERKFYYSPKSIKSITLGHYFAYPYEISEINNQVFEMSFAKKDDLRALLLDYMVENEILAGYTSRLPNLTSIGYYKGTVKKLADVKYSFTRVE